MGKIEVSKTCQSCKHANFKSGYSGRRKTGWCMLYTSPQVIPDLEDVDSILYNESKDNSRLMPFDEFVTAIEDRKSRNEGYHFYYSRYDHDKLRQIWDRFEKNFQWWEENRGKLKSIHVLNYCCDHERAKNARSPASGNAKRDGKIDWK